MTGIHYRVRGSGPVLLLLPGGDGDADAYGALGAELAADHTVVHYDRRGQARTALPPAASLAEHADDAAALLSQVSDEPAAVFGSSIGAAIGLELSVRHPGAVSRVVAHEPPISALLPDAEGMALFAAQKRLEDAYAAEGVAAAMVAFARLIAVNPADREPEVEVGRPDFERPNLEVFLRYDAPTVRTYRPHTAALRADLVVPAVGRSTDGPPAECAHALGALLGVPVAVFPGGHTAPTLRPRGVADAVRAALA
ncbi:alpha/beta fold hydrolase [Nocardia sp. NPDC057353]|uniref:alpha/beta fold hydrolase n=1 Tax=Nocardia sp. NPDC057353 TaxID=3346104 RepID=UPI00362D2654